MEMPLAVEMLQACGLSVRMHCRRRLWKVMSRLGGGDVVFLVALQVVDPYLWPLE